MNDLEQSCLEQFRKDLEQFEIKLTQQQEEQFIRYYEKVMEREFRP